MSERTINILRLLPVIAALLLLITIWWFFFPPRSHVLRFSTGSELGLYHSLAKEMKNVIEAQHSDISIELMSSAGSNENIERLDSGEVELAMVQNDARGGIAVRSIAGLYPEVLHLVCRKDAGIQSLSDLEGKSIGIGAIGSGTEQFASELLSFVGVSPQSDQIHRMKFSEAITQLQTGKLDAGFFLVGVGAAVIPEAWKKGQLFLVPLTVDSVDSMPPEEAAHAFTDGFRIHYPYVSPTTVPMMAYNGRPKRPVPAMSVKAVFVCRDGVGSDIISRITRTLFEQRAVLSQKESALSNLDEQASQEHLQFPIHEGAEYFYRRREPGFLAEHAEAMGFVLTAIIIGWSVVTWGQRYYAQHRKNRIDKFYKEVNVVTRKLNSITDLLGVNQLEVHLNDIRQRASTELVEEKLAADNAYLIYQNMLNGCQEALVRVRVRLEVTESDHSQ